MLSKKSKSLRKSQKEINSFRNKMGNNLIWFNSLGLRQQYDLLFLWKREKWIDSTGKRPKFIKKYDSSNRKWVRVANPPLKLSRWISQFKVIRKFIPTKKGIRNATLDSILNTKNNKSL